MDCRFREICVASGFSEDVKRLILDFIQEKTVDFVVFTKKWREHNFSAIYMGQVEREIVTFTSVIYQLTLEFLDDASFYYQVSVIYVLYCLYQCQIIIPPVRIRITPLQSKLIKNVLSKANQEGHKYLLYIIGFLYEHAFDFVAFKALYGPRTSGTEKSTNKNALCSLIYKEAREEMTELLNSGALERLKDLSSKYTDLKRNISSVVATETTAGFSNDFEKLNDHLKKFLRLEQNKCTTNCIKESADIGSRRSKLKTSAFEMKSKHRYLSKYDDSEEEDNEKIENTTIIRKKNVRKLPPEQRRVGRPSKARKEALLQILKQESLKDEEKNVVIPKKRGPVRRTKYLAGEEDGASSEPVIKPSEIQLSFSESSSEELCF